MPGRGSRQRGRRKASLALCSRGGGREDGWNGGSHGHPPAVLHRARISWHQQGFTDARGALCRAGRRAGSSIKVAAEMKNVTITLAEDLAAWARVEAAKANVSLSRYLADLLAQQRMRAGQDETVGLRDWLAHPGWQSAEQPVMTRSQLYEASYDRPGFPGYERRPLRDGCP